MNDLINIAKKVTNKIQRQLLSVYFFIVFVKRFPKHKKSRTFDEPSVWLNVNENYERHIYLLTKYFRLAGYRVFLKPNLKFLLSLGDPYAKLIIEENEIFFSRRKPKNAIAAFSDRELNDTQYKPISRDYFSTIFSNSPSFYHVPIGLHPNMYNKGLWNKPLNATVRRRSIFFAGEFNELEYRKLNRQNKFKMLDRITLGELIQTLPNANFPKTLEQLTGNIKDGQIDIVNRAVFTVPEEELRQTISNYYFFIACPGFAMPLSHNIFEAMSAGAIPILHSVYANMFHPALENEVNAIIYENNSFVDKLNEAVEIAPEKLKIMSDNVAEYYNTYLTPNAIVKHLISAEHDTYFLKERSSIKMMK